MVDRIRGERNLWVGGTEETNPTTATVMADTGALTRIGQYEALVIVGASAAASFSIQRRNAANSANVDVTRVYVPASGSGQWRIPFRIDADSERFRVMMQANLTGLATASIHYEFVA